MSPARPWGFEIAGLSVVIEGDGPRFYPAGFPPVAPPVMTLHAAPSSAGAVLRPVGDPTAEQDSWAAYYDAGHVTFVVKSGYQSPPEIARIDFDEGASTGTITYHAAANPTLLTFPADQLLLIQLLTWAGGVLAHGATVSNGERAVLLIGPSGAGKTTTARAAADRGLTVLSDERSVLRPDSDSAGAWRVGGTPWYGDGAFFDAKLVPLVAICALTQSAHDGLEPISPTRVMAELYRCHFPPLWSPLGCERSLSNVERLVSSVAGYRLHNTRGGGAVDLVKSLFSS